MTGEENRQRVRDELDRAERAIAAQRYWARRETGGQR